MFCQRFGTLRGLPKTAKLSFLAYETTQFRKVFFVFTGSRY
jgi:hypothetical protein